MRRAQVLIYAKPPRIGLSKTRLAETLGSAVEARRIAAAIQAKTVRAALQGAWKTILYTTPDKMLRGTACDLWPGHLERRSQGSGTLTQRLNKGLREALCGPVLFIGSDAPDISPALIRRAVRDLSRHDAVFGPARDGGFWLFGIHKTARTRTPFENVRWSGPHAMEDVWANLPVSASVAVLPQLIDIDDAKDWAVWRGQHEEETQPHPVSADPQKKGFLARLLGTG